MAAVIPISRTDREIQQDVMDELRWDPQIEANEIGVAAEAGVVTLSGHVHTYLQRMAAQEAAHRVRGVRAVANEVEVRLDGSARHDDSDIAAAAVRALAWDAALPADLIEVTVANGWVMLKGDVHWHYQREDAERVVRRLAGVRGVGNQLIVRPRINADDVKAKIDKAIVRDAALDASRIRVEVHGSKIILAGTVHTQVERRAAERAAWSAPGVTAVEDRILLDD